MIDETYHFQIVVCLFEHLKLPEIKMQSRLINCQLIPGLSDYDYSLNVYLDLATDE